MTEWEVVEESKVVVVLTSSMVSVGIEYAILFLFASCYNLLVDMVSLLVSIDMVLMLVSMELVYIELYHQIVVVYLLA